MQVQNRCPREIYKIMQNQPHKLAQSLPIKCRRDRTGSRELHIRRLTCSKFRHDPSADVQLYPTSLNCKSARNDWRNDEIATQCAETELDDCWPYCGLLLLIIEISGKSRAEALSSAVAKASAAVAVTAARRRVRSCAVGHRSSSAVAAAGGGARVWAVAVTAARGAPDVTSAPGIGRRRDRGALRPASGGPDVRRVSSSRVQASRVTITCLTIEFYAAHTTRSSSQFFFRIVFYYYFFFFPILSNTRTPLSSIRSRSHEDT